MLRIVLFLRFNLTAKILFLFVYYLSRYVKPAKNKKPRPYADQGFSIL